MTQDKNKQDKTNREYDTRQTNREYDTRQNKQRI